MSVLKKEAQSRDPGGGSLRQTEYGLTGTTENAASAGDATIFAHFHSPRGAAAAKETE